MRRVAATFLAFAGVIGAASGARALPGGDSPQAAPTPAPAAGAPSAQRPPQPSAAPAAAPAQPARPPAAKSSRALEAEKPGDPAHPVVAEIKIVGGTTITAETVEYYLNVSDGDPYDPAAIARNFRRFWDSGLVEDLKIESEEIAPGKVRLIVTVRERPKVTDFVFEGNKKMSTSTIKEKLDTANVSLKRNVPLKESDLQRLKQAIQDVYAKEGYPSALVDPVVTDAGPNQRKVTFKIDEGAKIKIGSIRFEGNKVFSDRRLRGALKKTKQKSLIWVFSKKTIWSKETWGEDSENLKKFYMNHGYKDVVVGEPRIELIARNPKGRTQKEKKFRLVVVIPVQEGKQFKMGDLSIKGNTVFPADGLRRLYEVKPGKIYNYSKIEEGNESVRNLYQGRGYIYSYTNQVLVERKDRPDTVDVVVSVYEGDRFRLGRMEFSGNTKTQEKVMRREIRLFEGDWMNMGAFKKSMFKVNQLGYFKLKEDPVEFKFDDKNHLVNVTVKGEEFGRTDVQFGAGYSELEGFFGQFSFNTRNFLGRGETIGLGLQAGATGRSYTLSFAEPYFMDKRMMVGASIYNQTLDYSAISALLSDYKRKGKGGSLVWGLGVADFGNFSLTYSYEDVFAQYSTNRDLSPDSNLNYPHRRPIPTPYKGILGENKFYEVYRGITSAITPAYGYDSRDDPFDPSQGISYFLRMRYAGGALGGDFHYLRPEWGMTLFDPLSKKTIFAVNFEGGIIKPIAGFAIPFYDRYRLGGERSLRGFEWYSVLPRTKTGAYFVDANGVQLGGDRYLQANIEYQIKLGGPLKLIFFSDIGNTWYETQGWDLGLLRYSYGTELRIFLPIFQAPLRFIYGINPHPFSDEKKSNFLFSIGSTF
ncbi:MAG TPA: outer membrane protein assembly factor BamA [Thermoanaerobaculaceae bacterium]|nr:outer membrane protein assembly factor BamA [Thermoanaerobaculaceae bacterium]